MNRQNYWLQMSLESWVLLPTFLLLSVTAGTFIGLRLSLPIWAILLLAVGAALPPLKLLPAYKSFYPESDSFDASCAIIAILALAWVAWILRNSYVLPAGDAVAGPTLARTILSGLLPLQVYPPGSSAYAYPPGYPIILAPVMAALPAPDSLLAVKALNLLTVGLIPSTWALLQNNLLRAPKALVLSCSYLAFFGLERTLGFALPFAGKNAVLFALLLAPLVFVLCIRLARTRLTWIAGCLPLFGLVLVHYTMLHMMAALLGLYAIVGIRFRTISWREMLRLLLMGSAVVVLMLIFMHEAVLDPRAGSFSFHPLEGLQSLGHDFRSYGSAIVIFMDAPFGLAASPFRLPILLGCALLSWILARVNNEVALERATLMFSGAIFVSLMFGYNIVAAGIQLDYVRWFLWALQAALLTVTLVGVCLRVKIANGLQRGVVFAALFLTFGYGVVQARWDGQAESKQNKGGAIPRAQLLAIRNAIQTDAHKGRCALIGDSQSYPATLTTIQRMRAWDYAEAVAPCDFLNGSWIQPGIPDGRDFKGLPSAGALVTRSMDRTLFFIGSIETFQGYQDYLAAAHLTWHWTPLGVVAGELVWRRDPS